MKADGETAEYSRLEAHLRRYTARNTFDYFIHKDLGGFLRRELDFYIKNEVMHLDDVENETAAKVEQYLSKIKVVRRIAGKVIDWDLVTDSGAEADFALLGEQRRQRDAIPPSRLCLIDLNGEEPVAWWHFAGETRYRRVGVTWLLQTPEKMREFSPDGHEP